MSGEEHANWSQSFLCVRVCKNQLELYHIRKSIFRNRRFLLSRPFYNTTLLYLMKITNFIFYNCGIKKQCREDPCVFTFLKDATYEFAKLRSLKNLGLLWFEPWHHRCSAVTNWAQQAYREQVNSCSRAVLSERHSTFFFSQSYSVLLVSFRYPFVLICSVWSSKDEILGCERFIWNP